MSIRIKDIRYWILVVQWSASRDDVQQGQIDEGDYNEVRKDMEVLNDNKNYFYSITALKGLLIGRIVRTKNFNWLFILQKQYIGRNSYRPTKGIVLVNEDCIDPDNPISLTRLCSTLTCFYIDNEMNYPTWEVYGMLENIEIGDKGVTIRCRRISEKTINMLIDKIVVQEKEIE